MLPHMTNADRPTAAPHKAPRKRKPTQRFKKTPLTDADWVDAATDILVNENVRGIRIETLCNRLGVTKGSFYWHFKGRPDLLAALLRTWRQRMTTNIIDRLTQRSGDATTRLTSLFGLTSRPKSEAFARIEESVRDWGRRDAQARDAVRAADETRLAYFEGLLVAHGLAPELARQRAYIAYAIMMGDSVLRQTLDTEAHKKQLVDEIVTMLTQSPAAPEDR